MADDDFSPADPDPTPPAPPRVTRVVSLPVRAVEDPENVALLDAFSHAWRLATDLANWCQRALATSDPGLRSPSDLRLAKYDPKCLPGGLSLYQHVTANCPFRAAFAGAAGSMGAVVKAVEDAWRSHPRFGRQVVLWKGEARACVFTYPYPWPVRSQELRVSRIGGRPHASVTLPGGRVLLRLADGDNFRRQLRQFDLLLAQPERLCAAKITGRRAGGRLVGADLRLVGEFDAGHKDDLETVDVDRKCAVITTGPAALLTVEIDGRAEPFVYVGEELRQVTAQHDGWRHGLATDLKIEKRWPSDKRRRIVGGPRVRARFDKAANRLRTARQQVVACVMGFLVRRGVRVVVYRDADKSFLPRFDWSGLRGLLSFKCEDAGIVFQHQAGANDAI